MAIQEAPISQTPQRIEDGALFPKLPIETRRLNQKNLKEKAVNHPLYKEAVKKTALEKGLKFDLTKPFEFEDDTEIDNNHITFSYQKDKEDPTIRRFKVSKRFSLSGPMQYESELDDRGPFVIMEMCLTYGDDPHISYSWSITDNSVRPQYYEDTQEAVDKSTKFIEFLAA